MTECGKKLKITGLKCFILFIVLFQKIRKRKKRNSHNNPLRLLIQDLFISYILQTIAKDVKVRTIIAYLDKSILIFQNFFL